MENLPRAESAQKRFSIIKLQKDFDRVRPIVLSMVREAGQLQVGKHDTKGINGSKGNDSRENNNSSGKSSAKGGPILQQALVGRDVDDLIMEEREQDIMRLNRDVVLVNEMFKYVLLSSVQKHNYQICT